MLDKCPIKPGRMELDSQFGFGSLRTQAGVNRGSYLMVGWSARLGRHAKSVGAIVLISGVGALSFATAASACVRMSLSRGPSGDLYLNSWAPNQAASRAGSTDDLVLQAGVSYTISVDGTFSAWGNWTNHTCGTPGYAPEYGSLNRPSTPVGDDAVFRFADPLDLAHCPKLATYVSGLFQVDLGSGWQVFTPNGGDPATPTTGTHSYVETVVGQGTKPQFRIIDWHPQDNDGELRIVVQPVPAWSV